MILYMHFAEARGISVLRAQSIFLLSLIKRKLHAYFLSNLSQKTPINSLSTGRPAAIKKVRSSAMQKALVGIKVLLSARIIIQEQFVCLL